MHYSQVSTWLIRWRHLTLTATWCTRPSRIRNTFPVYYERAAPSRTLWMQHQQAHIDDMLAKGELIEVNVQGRKGTYLASGKDEPLLVELKAGL